MKLLALIAIFAFSLTACGPESSPEGRMGIKIDGIQKQLDSLNSQTKALRDSLTKIRLELKNLKK